MKKLKMTVEKRKSLEGIVFIAPFIIGTFIYFIFPLFISIKLSFGRLIKMQGFMIEWLGIDNYIRAFIVDTKFVPMLLDTVKKTVVHVPLINIFSMLLGIQINKKIKLKGFFRTIFFIPFLLGTGEVLKQLYSMEIDKQVFSFVESNLLPREFLLYLGPRVVEVVENFFGTIVVVLWSSGVQILLFLSGFQAIPLSLYESARVDGATEWEMFWKITLPMISPTMLLAVTYTLIISFTDISNPILEYIQGYAFKELKFEYAAAIGWIYFLFIILLVSFCFMLFRNYIYTTTEVKGGKKA